MSSAPEAALHFPANALPLSLEDFLRDVRATPGRALRMPIQLRLGGVLGGAVHAVQVIASWAQQNDGDLALKLPAAFSEQENTRERFASTLPGMAALYFADSIQCNGAIFKRYKALEVVAPRVSAMQSQAFRDTLRGHGAALCCFSGAKSEFLTPLYAYPEPGQVRGVSDFRVLLPRMLSQLGLRSQALKEGQLDYLSGLVHQLFLNADEHGSFDVSGNRYEHAIRGIAVRFSSVQDIPTLVKLAGEDTSLKAYLLKQAFLKKGTKQTPPKDANSTISKEVKSPTSENKLPGGPMHLAEISVFDTGPGLALRWLADQGMRSYQDMSHEQELAAVQSCFQKHSTIKASQNFGLGLPMALTAMKRLDAFMTLRTGRLSLYQDFSHSNTEQFKPENRFTKDQELAEIAGTGYTMCFRVN